MAPPPSSSSPRPKVVGGTQAKSTSGAAAGASDTLPSSSASNPYATIDFPDGMSPHQRPKTPPLSDQPFPGISWPVPVDYSILEYPKESLKPVKKLGDGQFGDVYLCEISCCLQEGFVVADGRPDAEAQTMLVAVRMLRSNADDQAR